MDGCNAAKQTLDEKQQEAYAELLKPLAPRDPLADLAPRPFVKEWTVAELEKTVSKDDQAVWTSDSETTIEEPDTGAAEWWDSVCEDYEPNCYDGTYSEM